MWITRQMRALWLYQKKHALIKCVRKYIVCDPMASCNIHAHSDNGFAAWNFFVPADWLKLVCFLTNWEAGGTIQKNHAD